MLKDIKSLVLEGGGLKCAWQAGVIFALEETGSFYPENISSVSASSAIACAMISRRIEWGVRCFKSCIERNKKNIHWSHLFSDRPVFPHAAIYREALLLTFDHSAMRSLHNGPEIQVLIARTPESLQGYLGVFAGLSMHTMRRLLNRPIGRRLEGQVGFSKEFVSVKQCRTPAELADLVLASSCTPPITPLFSWNGRTALDGGLVEKVPISGVPEKKGATLVLLVGKRNGEDAREGLIFAEPSETVNVSSWDYTDAAKIDYLYALGKKDGKALVDNMQMSVGKQIKATD